MKHLIAALSLTVPLLLIPGGAVLAANPHSPGTTGQPNASCEAAGATTPGKSASSPGSAFADGGVAGQHYAGEDNTHSLNSNNPKAVSQYDCGCVR